MASTSTEPKESKDSSPPSTPTRWARARRLLYWTLILQLVATAIFIACLFLDEQSRAVLIIHYLPRHPLLAAAILGVLLAPQTKRRVRVLVALEVVTLLVVLFPVMGLRLGSARTSEHPIRLATYNVYWGWLGENAIFDEIAAMPADIILLQAANDGTDARLKERFPERSIHQDGEFVLLTRFKIAKVEIPPKLPDGRPSNFVGYVLETDSGPLRVFNVHPDSPRKAMFDDDRTGVNIRRREGQIAGAVAAAHREDSPFIMAGDTNLPALSSPGRRYFVGLHDAFDDVGFGFGYTFPVKRLTWMRIDRALAADGIRFLDVHVGKRGASDHYPLFVDFEMTNRR